MRNQVALVVLGSILGVVGTGVYDTFVRPRLFYRVEDMATFGNGYEAHNYVIKVTNDGFRPAEDISCRISVDGKISRASSVVNGETKTLIPDHPNAVLDRISYLNHGRSATFEISAEGRTKEEVFVLLLAKGVQGEKQVIGSDKTTEAVKAVIIGLIVGSLIIVLIMPNRRDEVVD